MLTSKPSTKCKEIEVTKLQFLDFFLKVVILKSIHVIVLSAMYVCLIWLVLSGS